MFWALQSKVWVITQHRLSSLKITNIIQFVYFFDCTFVGLTAIEILSQSLSILFLFVNNSSYCLFGQLLDSAQSNYFTEHGSATDGVE